ncbi:peptide-binding protein [Trinickia soli]|uniref:Peptide-binding protein n=2 Tax=Trinickia soli TaxID=380675 RepID=A0A2N7W7G0_9BURK|nr:peptide-binding protein [Paraburkholderia sp. T12-10]PMS25347.1 peptide-binding protein [Trinickia soli]
MADSAFHTSGRWAAAVLCAVSVSVAHARPPQGPRAAQAAYAARPAAPSFWRAPAPAAIAAPRPERPTFGITTNPYQHGGPRMAPSIAAAATPFRPVSDEARTFAREGGAAYLRAGSIRADIARYNEERGANHVPHPPPPGSRQPQTANDYRN